MSAQSKAFMALGVTAVTVGLAACGTSTTTGKPSAAGSTASSTASLSSAAPSPSLTTPAATTPAPTTGSPPSGAGPGGDPRKVAGPGPFTISQSGDPNTWPDACTLVSGAEIKALDPQITGLKGAPVGTKAQILGGKGGNAKHNTQCQFNLTTSFDPKDGSPPSYVTVILEIIGPDAPSLWQQNYQSQKASAAKYPDQFIDFANLPGGTSGFWDGTEVQTLRTHAGHGYDFWISGSKVTNSGSDLKAQKDWAHEIEARLAAKLGSEFN